MNCKDYCINTVILVKLQTESKPVFNPFFYIYIYIYISSQNYHVISLSFFLLSISSLCSASSIQVFICLELTQSLNHLRTFGVSRRMKRNVEFL